MKRLEMQLIVVYFEVSPDFSLFKIQLFDNG